MDHRLWMCLVWLYNMKLIHTHLSQMQMGYIYGHKTICHYIHIQVITKQEARVQNFLISPRIVSCSCWYCSEVIAPFSRSMCHLSNWFMHSVRKLIHLAGDIVPSDPLLLSFKRFEWRKKGLSGGSSYEVCCFICIMCAHTLICSTRTPYSHHDDFQGLVIFPLLRSFLIDDPDTLSQHDAIHSLQILVTLMSFLQHCLQNFAVS